MNWVSEKDAAEVLGYKPHTLRKYAKQGKWPIQFSCTGRKYQYSKPDLERLIKSNSSGKTFHRA